MLDTLINTIIYIDVSIFYLINIGMQNYIFDYTMPIITNAGLPGFWIVICICIYIFGGEKGKNTAVLCIIALLIGYFLTEFLKYIVVRPRPYNVLESVHLLTTMDGYSWPSGHTIAAFTGATLIGREYGTLCLILLILLASIVGFSRIYIGVHYPLDVVSGALIGVLLALLVLRFENSIISNFNALKQRIMAKN
ncbi:MAG: phosphatase PAP2 family protein [Methanobacterium sp.]|uniref:phosphatase PAP2 family protein n=1 Tax=Methanobacterium sp. TaxID=2164 RepID=UPI003D65A5EE|nr:phosphatase PAP2 family protein [Methanobacterium sp.]